MLEVTNKRTAMATTHRESSDYGVSVGHSKGEIIGSALVRKPSKKEDSCIVIDSTLEDHEKEHQNAETGRNSQRDKHHSSLP